ncbi:MAG: hypothetical protein ACYDBQ_02570 [Thermoplasmatota archaeon]
MNMKLVLPGAAALVLVCLAIPGNAYHIQDACVGTGCGDPTEWGAQVGVSDPTGTGDPTKAVCAALDGVSETVEDAICGTSEPCEGVVGYCPGATLVGFIQCEQDANPATGTPSSIGHGGLCDMSPGFTNPSHVCGFIGAAAADDYGNSNGFAPNYNGITPTQAGASAGDCIQANYDGTFATSSGSLPIISSPSRQWYEIKMQNGIDNGGSGVTFSAQINGVNCIANGNSVYYDDQFAYTVSNGLVSGFPTSAPPTGTDGGYTVTFPNAAPGAAYTACHGPQPWYYS